MDLSPEDRRGLVSIAERIEKDLMEHTKGYAVMGSITLKPGHGKWRMEVHARMVFHTELED
jgi:hypothetical protein